MPGGDGQYSHKIFFLEKIETRRGTTSIQTRYSTIVSRGIWVRRRERAKILQFTQIPKFYSIMSCSLSSFKDKSEQNNHHTKRANPKMKESYRQKVSIFRETHGCNRTCMPVKFGDISLQTRRELHRLIEGFGKPEKRCRNSKR